MKVWAMFRETHGTALAAINMTLIAIMAWFAFILALPWNTFPTGVGYHLFAALMPEEMWAAAFAIVAAIGVIGLWSKNRNVWTLSAMVLSTAHGTVALLTLFGNPVGIGSGTYLTLAALGYYLVWRRAG